MIMMMVMMMMIINEDVVYKKVLKCKNVRKVIIIKYLFTIK